MFENVTCYKLSHVDVMAIVLGQMGAKVSVHAQGVDAPAFLALKHNRGDLEAASWTSVTSILEHVLGATENNLS